MSVRYKLKRAPSRSVVLWKKHRIDLPALFAYLSFTCVSLCVHDLPMSTKLVLLNAVDVFLPRRDMGRLEKRDELATVVPMLPVHVVYPYLLSPLIGHNN